MMWCLHFLSWLWSVLDYWTPSPVRNSVSPFHRSLSAAAHCVSVSISDVGITSAQKKDKDVASTEKKKKKKKAASSDSE